MTKKCIIYQFTFYFILSSFVILFSSYSLFFTFTIIFPGKICIRSGLIRCSPRLSIQTRIIVQYFNINNIKLAPIFIWFRKALLTNDVEKRTNQDQEILMMNKIWINLLWWSKTSCVLYVVSAIKFPDILVEFINISVTIFRLFLICIKL